MLCEQNRENGPEKKRSCQTERKAAWLEMKPLVGMPEAGTEQKQASNVRKRCRSGGYLMPTAAHILTSNQFASLFPSKRLLRRGVYKILDVSLTPRVCRWFKFLKSYLWQHAIFNARKTIYIAINIYSYGCIYRGTSAYAY